MKKYIILVLVFVFVFVQSSFALDRNRDFGKPLLKEGTDQFQGEKMFTLKGIDDGAQNSFKTNIENLFYPVKPGDGQRENTIRKVMRNIMVAVLVLFFVMAGYKFVMDADDEGAVKKNQINFIYLLAGAAIIFTSTWILGEALSLNSVEGVVSTGSLTKSTSLLDRTENNIFVVVLGFLKGFAFFLAIILMFYYGYQMMIAFDKDEKIKAARTGVVNVILALLFIKIIDFLYYIAQQRDFTTRANNLVVTISKFLGYIFGILIVAVIIYIAFQFVTGGEEGFKKGLTWLKNIVIIALVVFLFILVINQVLTQLA